MLFIFLIINFCFRTFDDVLRKIQEAVPCICDPLDKNNYKQRWHTLLYLEEIATVSNMRQYDMPRANFKKSGDYLILEVPGLAEKRPSLICGDTVIVSNPCLISNEEGR